MKFGVRSVNDGYYFCVVVEISEAGEVEHRKIAAGRRHGIEPAVVFPLQKSI